MGGIVVRKIIFTLSLILIFNFEVAFAVEKGNKENMTTNRILSGNDIDRLENMYIKQVEDLESRKQTLLTENNKLKEENKEQYNKITNLESSIKNIRLQRNIVIIAISLLMIIRISFLAGKKLKK